MKFAVFASGNGTNLQALINKEKAGELAPAEIAVVVSNKSEIRALERAKAHKIPTEVVPHQAYPDRPSFERALLEVLERYKVDAVILAGFMRVLTPTFLDAFKGRVINTHPSLLPAFPGLEGAKQALEYGVRITGCTIHFVVSKVDDGPVIFQESIDVRKDDTADGLHARIQEVEHRLLPRAARLLALGAMRIDGRHVVITEPSSR